jgi:hypothetical protein
MMELVRFLVALLVSLWHLERGDGVLGADVALGPVMLSFTSHAQRLESEDVEAEPPAGHTPKC